MYAVRFSSTKHFLIQKNNVLRLVVYSIVMLLISSCGNKKKNDCGHFRNGEFYLSSHELATTWRIIRKDSIQKEIDIADGSMQIFAVTWIDDCECTLRFISRTPVDSFANEEQRKLRLHLRTLPTHVRMVNVGKNYYQVIVKKEGYKEYLSDTIWKADVYRGEKGLRPIGEVFKTK